MNTISEWSARLILLVSLLLLSAGTTWAGQGGGAHCTGKNKCVPEPASLTLLGVGVGAVLLYRYRRGPKK